MANDYGLFWDSVSGDRIYNAASFEEWLKKFFTTGVFSGDLEVTANNGMDIEVGVGYANLDGKVRFFDTVTDFTLSPANGTYPRIDTIVVQRDDTNREITLELVTGDYSGQDPQPTAPVRSGGIYQIVLAQIYVEAGTVSLTQGDITDKRGDTDVCGWVVGTVDSIDVDQLTAQTNAQIMEWFDEMRGQLSEDAAVNLQNQIYDIQQDLNITVLNVTLATASWSGTQITINSAYLELSKVKTLTYPVSLTAEQYEALQNASIRVVAEAEGSITLEALGDVPSIDLPIQVVISVGSVGA